MSAQITTRWSKLKRDAEAYFANSLSGRVTLFMTGYRTSHNEAGRWSIRIDGKEVGGSSDFASWRAKPWGADANQTYAEKQEELRSEGLHDRNAVLHSLHEYLSLDNANALISPDPLIRTLAILDRRTGKRRLRELAAGESLHPLEKHCLEVRCQAEGITKSKPDDAGTSGKS